MGLPFYLCCSRLPRCWWKPMEWAGFGVELFPHTTRRSGPQEEIIDSGAIVFAKRGRFAVSVTEVKRSDKCWQVIILYFRGPAFFLQRGQLRTAIEAILLASGAKAWQNAQGCKIIYKWAFPGGYDCWKNWCREFCLQRGRGLLSPHGSLEIFTAKLRCAGTSIRLLGGPAIDPETEQKHHFLAIDYPSRVWTPAARKGLKVFLLELKDRLLASGAKMMGIITTEGIPPWIGNGGNGDIQDSSSRGKGT